MTRRYAELAKLLALGVLTITLAPLTERYAGLVVMGYLVFAHIAERVIWSRYLASTQQSNM